MAPDDRDGDGIVEREPPLRPATEDRGGLVAAVLAAVGAVVFAGGLVADTSPAVYGTGLAVGTASLGVAVRRYFLAAYPRVQGVEPRSPAPEDAGERPLSEVQPVGRHGGVRRLLLAAAAVLGVSLLAPVSSLGPRVGDRLRRTAWERGARLVTTDGALIRPSDVVVGSVVTAWPEDAVGDERSAVIVVRLSGGPARAPTELEWVVDRSLVAYSKICTHAGCPVGLFRDRADALFCPCHQTTFDAARAATPTFGPAVRPLPQLPLAVGSDGFLVALGDFVEQVGPPFGWLPQ